MRFNNLARTPPQWLRVCLAALLLAFALNSIAHVTHRHDPSARAATHSLACGYCISFDGIADGPRHNYIPPAVEHASVYVAPASVAAIAYRPASSARPRAPPLH